LIEFKARCEYLTAMDGGNADLVWNKYLPLYAQITASLLLMAMK